MLAIYSPWELCCVKLGSVMRWYSWIAAGLLAAGLIFGIQLPANSASKSDAAKGWRAEVALEDGAPREILPQSFEALRAKLAPDDPVAVLEAVGYALNEVADGATYVWHRTDGPLMGNVRMAAAYRSEAGAICRRMTLTLILGDTVRPASLSACRDSGGEWVVGG